MELTKIKKVFSGKILQITAVVLAGLVIILVIFQLGACFGRWRAERNQAWGENYQRNFAGPRGGFMREMDKKLRGRDMVAGHGIFGTVLKIDGNNLIIKDGRGTEQVVVTTEKTAIRRGVEDIKITDLKVDEQVTVIGSPNKDGQIDGKFIRVFDGKIMLPPQK